MELNEVIYRFGIFRLVPAHKTNYKSSRSKILPVWSHKWNRRNLIQKLRRILFYSIDMKSRAKGKRRLSLEEYIILFERP